MTNKSISSLQCCLLRLAIVLILYLIISVSFTSCINFERLMMGGGVMIDTPANNKNDKIIQEKILPYIAKVLDYNDPYGTDDPILQAQFRRIPTVNNMNNDNVVNCQDYALLFYALCRYHNIPVKCIGNLTFMHAYNQIQQGFGTPVDIEPQGGESRVFYDTRSDAMHGWTGNEGEIRFRINTHPDNREFDPFNWGDNDQSRGWSKPNLTIINYVIFNGKLPN